MSALQNPVRTLLLAALATLAALPLPAQRGPGEGRGVGTVGPNGPGAGVSNVERATPGFSGPSMGGSGFVRNGGREGRGMPLAMPPRPNHAPQVKSLAYFQRTRILVPPGWWPRCAVVPNGDFWGRRDIMAEIQWLSRAGFIPVTPVDPSAEVIEDYAFWPAGWKAYGFVMPPGGRLQVEVEHTKLGWFRLMAVDKWGTPGPGMLQAAIAPHPVMITLTNPRKEASAVYVIVDDPGWWSSKEDPFRLLIRRDWDPARTDLSGVKLVAGIWGSSPSVSAQFRHPSLSGPAVFPR
jgi:hypothetical protein